MHVGQTRGFLIGDGCRAGVQGSSAVEAATGGVGASAPTAAEWDDRGERVINY